MKYIDVEKLQAEIGKYIKGIKDAKKRYIPNAGFFDAKLSGIYNVLGIVAALQQEQPEVDLEEEIDNYIGEHFSEAHDGVLLSDASRMELMITDVAPMARYFYELGLKAKKEV